MSKCGCEKKKTEEKKHKSSCGGCTHGAEKTATNNQWGK